MNYKRKLLLINILQQGDYLRWPKNPMKFRSIIIRPQTGRIKTHGNCPKTTIKLEETQQLGIFDTTRIQPCPCLSQDRVEAPSKPIWIRTHWLEMLWQILTVGQLHQHHKLQVSTVGFLFQTHRNKSNRHLCRHSITTLRHYRLIMIIINNSERIKISNPSNNSTVRQRTAKWGHNRQNYLQTCPGTTIKLRKQPQTKTITTYNNSKCHRYIIILSSKLCLILTNINRLHRI
jgi:hypothetical protein